MTLQDKILYARGLPAPVVFLGLLVCAKALPGTSYLYAVSMVIALAYMFYVRWVKIWLGRRAGRRADRLTEAQDYEGARGVLQEIRVAYAGSGPMKSALRIVEAGVLSQEGRHVDAVALLRSMDAAQVPAVQRPAFLNNLAWSLALSGDPASAVPLARESVSGPDSPPVHRSRACRLGTLGTALVLAGDPAEGVTLLEEAMTRGGKPREQAVRAFYLGEGLRALGRHDEATKAYDRAMKEAPSTELAQRAAASLAGMRAYRS